MQYIRKLDWPPSFLPHTGAFCGRQFLHFVPAMTDVEKDHVFMMGGPTTGLVMPLAAVLQDATLQEVGDRQVVVGGETRAGPAAVLKQHGLVRVVPQPKVSHLEQDGVESAWGFGAAGRSDLPCQLPLGSLLFLIVTSSLFIVGGNRQTPVF